MLHDSPIRVVVTTLLLLALMPPAARAQTIEWFDQFETAADEKPRGVARHADGSVYVTGLASDVLGERSFGGLDVFLRKYDASGAEVWTLQFGSDTEDQATDIACDLLGNVYVVGWTVGVLGASSAGSFDAFIAKFDGDGTELWRSQFGTASVDQAASVAVDWRGNVYVAGHTDGLLGFPGGGGFDAFVRKYDRFGTPQWTRQFGTQSMDVARGVDADGDGNVYVVGDTEGAFPGFRSAGNLDVFVRRYDRLGNATWTRQFGTVTNDFGWSAAVDWTGRFVYVGGAVAAALPGMVPIGSFDVFLRKYDAAGAEMWTRQFGTPCDDLLFDTTVDGPGNVYVVGRARGPAGFFAGCPFDAQPDAVLSKWTDDGAEAWSLTFASPRDDEATGVAVNQAGDRVHVVGVTYGSMFEPLAGAAADGFVITLRSRVP